MGIADELIDKISPREGHISDAPSGYYLDDLGFYVEEDIQDNKKRYAEYLLFRIRYLHHNIYKYGKDLYKDYKKIGPNRNDILMLIDSPSEKISISQALWIYNRIFEEAPVLSDRCIKVSSDFAWDYEKCELVKLEDLIDSGYTFTDNAEKVDRY